MLTDSIGNCSDTASISLTIICDTCITPMITILDPYCYGDSTGSIITESTSYDYSRQMIKSDSTFSNDNSASSGFIYTGELDDDGMGQVIDVFSPYDSSVYTQMMMRTSGHAGSNWRGQFGGGALQQQSLITGVHFYSNNAGAMTTIKVSVYGLRES